MRESRSPPPFNEEPQISKDFWGFFVFLHRISRMNRMAILLIGLLTDFRGYLAAGQWLAPEMGSYCFSHADFADDADFFLLIILVPQISQIHTDFFSLIILSHRFHRFTQIFSHWLFCPTDFTDLRRFFWSFFFLISINHNIMVYNLRISERINKLLRNS